MQHNRRDRINRTLAALASVALVVGLMPSMALAGPAEEPNEPAVGAGPTAAEVTPAAGTDDTAGTPDGKSAEEPAANAAVNVQEEEAPTGSAQADNDAASAPKVEGSADPAQASEPKENAAAKKDDGNKEDAEGEKAESPAFNQSETVDGVTVTVEADAGVFPEGARLSVESAPSAKTEAAVAPERDADVNVAASCTFDVKVLDANGKEIQPAGGRSVKVSFKAAEVADPNLDVSVYHVAEGAARADKLDVDVSGKTATAESSGFSFYTVEFTYGDLQYVLQGGEKVPLADVLSAVGLSGEVTGVEVSNPELFSASKEKGAWVITSHKAFSSSECMRITIDGKAYEIRVTDDNPTSGECGDNLTWTLDDEGIVTISGTGPMRNYSSGSGGHSPWRDSNAVKGVVIEDGVTSIGNEAFYNCRSLESVEIPGSVTSIGNRAFYYCRSLESVEIPGSVTSIHYDAFEVCQSLKSVEIPGSVDRIESNAFRYCSELESVTIRPGVRCIERSAFEGCGNLEKVAIPSTVTIIYENAFKNCSEINSSKGIYFSGSESQWQTFLNTGIGISSGSEVQCMPFVPISVSPQYSGDITPIGEYSLKDNQWLYHVQATPKTGYRFVSWTRNGEILSDQRSYTVAFSGNTAPQGTTVNFESGIGGVCGDNLTWKLDGEDNNLTLTITGSGDMYDYFGTDEVPWCDSMDKITSIGLPDGITTIGSWAFQGCGIQSIEIPDSVKIVGVGAFRNCTSLTSVTIKEGVTSIGASAFEASGLTSVEIPISVKTIGKGAFEDCNELEAVAIPSSVTSVGSKAFDYNEPDNSARQYYFGGTVEQFASLMGIRLEDARLMVEKVYHKWLVCMPAVAISSSFEEGGSAEGVGAYSIANSSWSYAATAAPNSDYKFVNWTENGTQVSSVATDIFSVGENGRTLVANFESTTTSHTITTEANPTAGGSVTGGGSHARGGTVTLTAAAATDKGYHFVDWTENDTQVSTDASYSFIATDDRTLVANFAKDECDITAAVDPGAGGTVSGGGTFTYGQTATLTATPSEGYVFDYWSTAAEPNTSICKTEEYKFAVEGPQSYVAHFKKILIKSKDSERITDQMYTGGPITPEVSVYLDGVDVALVDRADYTVDYRDNVNVGTAKITVTLTGSYKGTGAATFGITPAGISTATVEVADQMYDGTELKPVPTVTWGGKQVAQEDYTTSYADNVRAGTATVTVAGKRNFSEASKASGTFKIAKRPVTITANSAEREHNSAPLTADGFTSEGLAAGDKVASAKVEGSQTAVGSSANKVSGAKVVNAEGEDVTDCYDITYKDGTLTVTPEAKGIYTPAEGSGQTWTKGSTDSLTFPFKRASDDEKTFDLFKGVEVDGKAVPEKDASGKANWTAKKGSLILSLQPSFLETLSDGDHTVKALFEDGAGEASFKVAAPVPDTKNTTSSKSPKTGDEASRPAAVFSMVAAAALCLALFALTQLKRRKPTKAGKHARR